MTQKFKQPVLPPDDQRHKWSAWKVHHDLYLHFNKNNGTDYMPERQKTELMNALGDDCFTHPERYLEILTLKF